MQPSFVIFDLECAITLDGRAARETLGVSPAMNALRRMGAEIALASRLSRTMTDIVIETLGWDRLLDVVVTRHDVPRGSRLSEALLEAALNLTETRDVTRLARVSNDPMDIRAARARGCSLVFGVARDPQNERELRAAGAWVLPTPALVPEALRRVAELRAS